MKENIECPLCDDQLAELKSEFITLKYKGDDYKVISYFYKCNFCNLEFTTEGQTDLVLNQVYAQHSYNKSL